MSSIENESDEDGEEGVDDDDDEDEKKKIVFKFTTNELLNATIDQQLLDEYDQFMERKFGEQERRYYTYANAFLDNETGKLKPTTRFYDGKGTGLRYMNAFLTAFICLELGVPPITNRIQFITKKLRSKAVTMGVVLTNVNLTEKDSLVRETAMFEVESGIEWCNIATSSIDISKLKLTNEEATKRQLNIRSVRNLATEETIIMSYKNLKEQYENQYSTIFRRFDRTKLTEKKIAHLIPIRRRTLSSGLNGKQKLIILIQILIFLNDKLT